MKSCLWNTRTHIQESLLCWEYVTPVMLVGTKLKTGECGDLTDEQPSQLRSPSLKQINKHNGDQLRKTSNMDLLISVFHMQVHICQHASGYTYEHVNTYTKISNMCQYVHCAVLYSAHFVTEGNSVEQVMLSRLVLYSCSEIHAEGCS